MALQQDIVSRLTRVHWLAGNWLVLSWQNESRTRDKSPNLTAYLDGMPALGNIDICVPNYRKTKQGVKKPPDIEQTITTEMQRSYIAWSYPGFRDAKEEISTIETEVWSLYVWEIIYMHHASGYYVGAFATFEEALAYVKENLTGFSVGGVPIWPDGDPDLVSVVVNRPAYEYGATKEVITTTYTTYTLKEAGVLIINASAIKSSMRLPPPAKPPTEIKFSISFPGTDSTWESFNYTLKAELYAGKHKDFHVDSEGKPTWEPTDRESFVEVSANIGIETRQEEARAHFTIDVKTWEITCTVEGDGAYVSDIG